MDKYLIRTITESLKVRFAKVNLLVSMRVPCDRFQCPTLIDLLAYGFYGLTLEEIAIVEGTNKA